MINNCLKPREEDQAIAKKLLRGSHLHPDTPLMSKAIPRVSPDPDNQKVYLDVNSSGPFMEDFDILDRSDVSEDMYHWMLVRSLNGTGAIQKVHDVNTDETVH